MHHHDIEFPLIVGLRTARAGAVPQTVLSTLRNVLTQRSSSGVLIVHADETGSAEIAEAARACGASYRAIGATVHTEGTEPSSKGLTKRDRQLVEAIDLLLLVSDSEDNPATGTEESLLNYARGIGRPVIYINGRTGMLAGDFPEQLEIDQGWLPGLFEMAGLTPDADLESIKSKMSALANKSAPITRSQWNWIVFLEGLAVCVPLGWLLGFPVRFVGLAAFGSTLLLVGLYHWLRWKSMQKTWAQARLVAEATRSLIATSAYPDASPWHTLATIPALRPLRWARRPSIDEESFDNWIKRYIKDRLSTQQDYFASKRKEAEAQRKKLTFWTSRLLDVVFVFALVGLVLVFTPAGEEWMVGGGFSSQTLGSLSILALVGLLLVQIVRELHELNRRTARFAQQELVLQDAIARLNRIQSPELALEIVSATESKLLTEVLEWYFHAETAERFGELRERAKRTLPRNFFEDESTAKKVAFAIPGKAGTAGLFVLKAIVRQLPLPLLSAAGVVLWIFYHMPDQGANIDRLEEAVHLLSANGTSPFGPPPTQPEQQNFGAQGYVVMVHGLWGLGIWTDRDEENKRNWMKRCADEITNRMKNKGEPEICLVDWSKAARPSDFYNRVFGERSVLADVPAIRAQAYRIGDIVAFRLAGIILSKNLPTNVPVLLIGHSAGGFVVTRVARRLAELGLIDKSMVHVTILDTPGPDKEMMEIVPQLYPKDAIDFSISSGLGARMETLRAAPFSANVHKYNVPPEKAASQDANAYWIFDYTKSFLTRVKIWGHAHQYSFVWYTETVKNPNYYPDEGFNRSPLGRRAQPLKAH